MRRLNKASTGRRGDTDVLAFNFDEPRGRDYFLGEIYISVDRLRRQAADYRQSLKSETALLFIHGFLHLLGYDHERGGGARRRMETKQAACHRAVLGPRTGSRP
jgi:probable rRNA maturation factor